MQVYSLPEELEATVPPLFVDGEFNENLHEQEKAHQEQVAQWLKDNGFDGPYSGKVAKFPHGDGYARYMLADSTPGSGNRSFLIHLPYLDGYNFPYIDKVPKRDIIKQIKSQEAVKKLFGQR